MPPVEAASAATVPSTPAAAAAPPPEPAAQPPPRQKGPDPAKVKAILEAREARGRAGSAPAPSASATGTPAAANPETAPGTAAPAAAEEGDAALAKRLARLATQEEQIRSGRAELEKERAGLTEYRAWKDARAKDPAAAVLQHMTEPEQDALYWKLHERILSDDAAKGKAATPEEVARRIAREELAAREKDQETSRETAKAAELESARGWYVGTINEAFNKDIKKWPAIAARGVTAGDIHTFAEDHYKREGSAPDAATVLDHFQRKYESEFEANGYTRQKVEAQPGGERPRGETTTVTSEWSAGSVPSSEGANGEQSLKESKEEIKRRHFGPRK